VALAPKDPMALAPKDWPANEPEELARQLEVLVDRLHAGEVGESPVGHEAYLTQVLVDVWRAVARGELRAPRRWLERLSRPAAFARRHRSSPGPLQEEAARAIDHLLHTLTTADEALGPWAPDGEISGAHRHPSENGVLAVLRDAPTPLQRKQVHEALSHNGIELTRQRVGQILVDLHDRGLLTRATRPARGSPEVSFYHLSGAGIEACKHLPADPKGACFERALSW